MAAIKRWYLTERPRLEEEQESIQFPSPNGQYSLILYDQYEFAMGGYVWQFKLLHRDMDITPHLPGLDSLFYHSGYQPWHYASDVIALNPYRHSVSLYSISTNELVQIPTSQFTFNIQGAPDMNRFLLTSRSGGLLIDNSGSQVALVPWPLGEHQLPYAFWLNSGRQFFQLNHISQLQFFSGEDGTLQQSIDIMPSDYLPVVMNSDWENPQFDQTTNTLYVVLYRKGGEQWVAFELEP